MQAGSDAAARLRDALPPSLRDPAFLGLEPWQWAMLGVVLLAGLLVAAALRGLAGSALLRQLAEAGSPEHATRVRHAVVPLAHCLAGLFWLRALPLTGLTDVPLALLQGAARLYALAAAAWLGVRLADLAGDRLQRTAARTPSRLDDLFGPLVRKSLKVAAVGIAAIFALRGIGLDVGPLVASLGLGGLAVAFAAKDTIENFFGSIAVIVDRPFEVGDTIAVAGVEGQVQEVGFRSTRLRTSRGTLVTLPNATLVRATVERLGDASRQTISFTLKLDAATTPEQLTALRDAVRSAASEHPRAVDDETEVRLASISEGGLDLLIRVVLRAGAASAEREDRERLLLDVLRLARAHGVTVGAARPQPPPSAAPGGVPGHSQPPPPAESPLVP